jgi:hypothetical protein
LLCAYPFQSPVFRCADHVRLVCTEVWALDGPAATAAPLGHRAAPADQRGHPCAPEPQPGPRQPVQPALCPGHAGQRPAPAAGGGALWQRQELPRDGYVHSCCRHARCCGLSTTIDLKLTCCDFYCSAVSRGNSTRDVGSPEGMLMCSVVAMPTDPAWSQDDSDEDEGEARPRWAPDGSVQLDANSGRFST